YPTEEDDRVRPASGLSPSARVFLKVRNGTISEASLSTSESTQFAYQEAQRVSQALEGRKLQGLDDWFDALRTTGALQDSSDLGAWLNKMLPPTTTPS
ncbi:hypothetical protein LTR60_006136, partial [Cryomyces antarcticus]